MFAIFALQTIVFVCGGFKINAIPNYHYMRNLITEYVKLKARLTDALNQENNLQTLPHPIHRILLNWRVGVEWQPAMQSTWVQTMPAAVRIPPTWFYKFYSSIFSHLLRWLIFCSAHFFHAFFFLLFLLWFLFLL